MQRAFFILVAAFGASAASANEPVDLLIVAGQSNAVGYDAKPGDSPEDESDQKILFWWRCGDPPPDNHDSTSGSKWTHLQAQPPGDPILPRQGRQYGNFAQPEGGFGPEIGLARTIYAKERKKLAVVKVAFSGTSLGGDWNHDDAGEAGSCYRSLVDETRTAIATAKETGLTINVRALVWVQGESDAKPEAARKYAGALESMIAALRNDLDAPDLVALLAVNTQFGGGRNKFMPTIVRQQKLVASGDPLCEYVDTSKATIANGAHFDATGTLDVGRWMAESLIRVEAKLKPTLKGSRDGS